MIPRIHLFILIGLVALDFVLGTALFRQLPDPAPIHWNMHGHADGYGAPWIDAFFFPCCTALAAALIVVVPRFAARRTNFDRFARTYGRIVVTIALGLLAIHVVVLLKATGHPLPLDRAIIVIVGLLISVLGNWMGKIRRNSFCGIRTPWTLSSDLVWERTHRIGGPFMVVYGLAAALAGLCIPGWAALIVLIGGALALVAWAMFYSWSLHNRLGAGGSSAVE